MLLVSATVQHFRSITTAYKIRLGRSTVLIGPNNEGKSNILKALVVGMRVLTSTTSFLTLAAKGSLPVAYIQDFYRWQEDFPIARQKSTPKGESLIEFEFEFELSELETAQFRQTIKSNLNGTLPIRVSIGPSTVTIKVAKKGPGGTALTAKSPKIAQFISDRLDFQHIQAVRTAQSAAGVVDAMVKKELQAVETDPAYAAALDQIAKLQEPILARLSSSIKSTLVTFLPAIRNVEVRIASSARNTALRSASEIIIDDGNATPLKSKGDGVQSLAALALVRHASERTASSKNVILALEEPESHLHPNAIHGLKAVLQELAEKQQIVLTTHCPLFVDRANLSANVIVLKNKARPAKSVEEIRDILGVRASDNLRHAEIVLLVEGEEDRLALVALLRAADPCLDSAISEGRLAIDTLGGGSNLSYKVGLIRDALCLCHCFLDDDKAGRDAFQKAAREGLLTAGDVNFCSCVGMPDAEIEDMFDQGVYGGPIQDAYRVTLQCPTFKTNKKWSDRLRETFKIQGKPWDDKLERDVKKLVAEAVVANPRGSLNPHKRGAFDALVRTLNGRLEEPVKP